MSPIHWLKLFYDRYPNIIKKSGLLEITTLPPYRSIYLKKIESQMQIFNQGAIAVEFEVTNNCNADCIMCPNSLMKRPIARMDMNLFQKIVDEFAAEKLPLIKFVFAGLGEPTLDPLLHEKIKYLKIRMPQIPVQVTTNASLLTDKKAKELIDSGLDHMIISFNGTTPESYEHVMGNLKYEKTIENILNFMSLRQNNKPHITISCVRLDANANDFAGLKKFWTEKGVEFDAVKTPVPFNRGGDQMDSRYQSKWALPKPTAPRQMYPCRMMAENLLIHPNGAVALCFVDYEEKHVMGQFGVTPLRQILNNKHKWYLEHKKGNFSQTPLCKNCSFMREQTLAWWKSSYF